MKILIATFTFPPNNDGISEAASVGVQAFLNVSNIATEVKEVDEAVFSVYPNPNVGNGWNLKGLMGLPQDWTVQFFDLAGKLACPAITPDDQWHIQTSLSSGVYLLRACHLNGKSHWKKVVVLNP